MGFLYINLYTSYIHMWSTISNFLKSCIVIARGYYFRTVVNVQLVYNVRICDHATCSHFHHPLWDTFVISFQL